MKLTSGLSVSSRGDTTNTNLQNMEPVSETDEEQVPEDLGKLTVVDKARTGRVSLKTALSLTSNVLTSRLCDYVSVQGANFSSLFWFLPHNFIVFASPSPFLKHRFRPFSVGKQKIKTVHYDCA